MTTPNTPNTLVTTFEELWADARTSEDRMELLRTHFPKSNAAIYYTCTANLMKYQLPTTKSSNVDAELTFCNATIRTQVCGLAYCLEDLYTDCAGMWFCEECLECAASAAAADDDNDNCDASDVPSAATAANAHHSVSNYDYDYDDSDYDDDE